MTGQSEIGAAMAKCPYVVVLVEDDARTVLNIQDLPEFERELAEVEDEDVVNSALSYFAQHAVAVPLRFVQRLQWAQSERAKAEGAILSWMIDNNIRPDIATTIIASYEEDREAKG